MCCLAVFQQICAGNYSFNVNHPQMSRLKRECTSPACFKDNLHLCFFSSFSPFSTQPMRLDLCVRMSNRLKAGQPEPRDMSEKRIGSEEEGNRDPNRVRRSEEVRVSSVANTISLNPNLQCKYLDMAKVGCLIPPFKDVLFRWTRSKKHKSKY